MLKKKLEDAEHFKDTIWYQKNYGKMIRRRDRLRAVVPAKYDPFGED